MYVCMYMYVSTVFMSPFLTDSATVCMDVNTVFISDVPFS